MTTEASRTFDVEVLPRQMKEALWSLNRSNCRTKQIEDGRAGTKRITYIMPEREPPKE